MPPLAPLWLNLSPVLPICLRGFIPVLQPVSRSSRNLIHRVSPAAQHSQTQWVCLYFYIGYIAIKVGWVNQGSEQMWSDLSYVGLAQGHTADLCSVEPALEFRSPDTQVEIFPQCHCPIVGHAYLPHVYLLTTTGWTWSALGIKRLGP